VPERAPWWAILGTLLPRDVRERVYEPACYERLRDRLEAGHHGGLGLYPVGAFMGTAGRNLPRIWFEGRCLTGLGKAAVAGLLTAAGFWVIQLVRYAYAAGY
jgi:hypothetical protein